MGLSFDLISEFVKITNDKKESPKEGTVYATVVSGTGGKYVKIDGSDLLTPMETTTDIEDGERVTLMIKDHKAVVTGNVTNPSASTGKVDKVTDSINSVSDRVGTFELVVADKVSTNELEAYKATIEVLIAGKATIEDLTATNAKIENLEVKNAEIENLVAEKATITDLEVVNATIDNLKAKDAEIENAVIKNLEATTADIKVLNADFAQIKTLVNGNLTSDNILSFNLTSGKVTVDDAFIKDAMIDTISAAKINSGEINTNVVTIGSEDGGMLITGSTQQFTDKNGNVRIQIGKDASGDFTFVLYGEDGTGQLINQNGITASAIGDGLIVNNMVSDNAAISGGKLDISSVIMEINGDNSTTINSSKIYLNEQKQSLEVAFNSLKTKVDTFQDVTIQGDLTAIVEQVQSNTTKIEANTENISTLIAEDTVIKKQVTDLKGTVEKTETTLTSKYTSLNQSLEGFKTTVADTYATKSSVTDVVDNLNTNYSTTSTMNSAIDQKVQEISASVSSTYATKNEVKTLDDNLKTNYSTTRQMESAINIAKEEINLGVSSVYETKENTTSKINSAVNNIQVGGTNLWVLSDLTDGYEGQGNITSGTAQHKIRQTQIPTNNAKELVYQCWNPLGVTNNTNSNRVAFFDNNHNLISSTQVPKLNGDLYQWQLITIPTNSVYVRLAAICGSSDGVYEPSIKIKFEFGNKPTGYNLAPEDVIDDIQTAKHEAITSANNNTTTVIQNYYTKAQTDSQINVAKEAINLGVSTTYETKANVESKVSSSLDSAKSYADTKKTEAINSAASDASTKVNSAKTELNAAIETKANSADVYKKSEVYTRAQTDSQINVAKEAINLGVSTTYETKENTTSKIQNAVNNIQVGGTNLWVLSDLTGGYLNSSGVIVTKDVPWAHLIRNSLIELNNSREIIYQCWNPNRISNGQYTNRIGFYGSDKNFISCVNLNQLNGDAYQRQTINVPSNAVYVRLAAICGAINSDSDPSIKIKFEFGNKPTDYSLAPEDVTNDISTAKNEAINSANNTLSTTIANYYTKAQTDSQISVAKNEINLGVSNTYETKTNVTNKINSITVGGKNLVKQSKSLSDTQNTYTDSSTGRWVVNNTGNLDEYNQGIKRLYIETTITDWVECQIPLYSIYDTITAPITVSFNYYESVAGMLAFSIGAYNNSNTRLGEISNITANTCTIISENGAWKRVSFTINNPSTINGKSGGTTYKLQFKKQSGYTGLCQVKFPKVEIGNKASDWSPAPEDIETNANNYTANQLTSYYTKEQTDSQINIAKEAINLGVSNTYETKTNVSNKFANYYTKTQTDSAINVAKNEINLGVSSTYETKENTTSKINSAINGIQVGGTNLWVLSDTVTGYDNNGNIQNFDGSAHKIRQTLIPTNGAKQIIYQCWNPNGVVNESYANRIAFFNSSKNYISSTTLNRLTGQTYQLQIINIPDGAAYMRLAAICGPVNVYDETIKIKFELGNKPTSYNLAPEDTYTKEQTNSQINIAKNAINLEVAKKVNSDSIISSINLSPESIRISSNKISIDGAVVINSINGTTSTSITGNKIRTGVISSNNNRIKFDLDNGYILAYDESGSLVGRTVSNKMDNTTIYGMSSAAEAGKYVAMSYKVNSSDSTYSFGVVCTGTDNLGGSSLKRGVNIQAPLHINATTRVNGYLKWDGFTRSSGDKVEIYKTTASTESNLYLRLADDNQTNFRITCNHYTKGHMAIAKFRYPNSSDGSVAGIDFYTSLNMHKWYIQNAKGVSAASLSADSLSLTSDTATIQSTSPVALMALDNDFNDIQQATKTQYIATSTQKQIMHTGTIEIGSDKIEYVELPEDFLMCVDIQIVASPNKLCKFAITSKDEYGFIIETDTENVAFDYVVTGTKMDGAILDLPEEEQHEYCINENDEIVPYVVKQKL